MTTQYLDDEFWTEYRFRDSDYIAPAPKPSILHPIDIKRLYEKGKHNCPIINRLIKRFGLNIRTYPDISGRFLQAAYN